MALELAVLCGAVDHVSLSLVDRDIREDPPVGLRHLLVVEDVHPLLAADLDLARLMLFEVGVLSGKRVPVLIEIFLRADSRGKLHDIDGYILAEFVVRVLEPIDPETAENDPAELQEIVRKRLVAEVAAIRGAAIDEVN